MRTIGIFVAGGLLAGCAADMPGAPQEGVNVAEAVTLSGNAKSDIRFFGSIKLDSVFKNSNGNADNLELISGGVDATSTLTKKNQVYDHQTDTLTPLRNAGNTADIELSTALVESVIAKIPNETDVYLVATGRTAVDGTPSALSYILTISRDVNNKIASAKIKQIGEGGMIDTGTALPSGRVFTHKSIKQCGSAANQQLIAFGGTTSASGWQSMASLGATRDIYVLTYHSGHDGGDSKWDVLKDSAMVPNTVRLIEARGYAEVLNKSDTDFFVDGGLASGSKASKTVDRVVVSSSCVADANHLVSDGAGFMKVEAATDMPGALARFASIQIAPATVSGVDYDFIVGGGNSAASYVDGTALPTATYLFDPDGTTTVGMVTTQGKWTTTGTSIQEGRVFPRFVAANASGTGGLPTVVKLLTGIMPRSGHESTDLYYNTSLVNDVFTSSTAAWTTGTALAANKDRVGVFGDLLKNNATLDPVVGLGAKHTNTTGASGVNATSMPQDVLSVP
jgi:hypothetical protein